MTRTLLNFLFELILFVLFAPFNLYFFVIEGFVERDKGLVRLLKTVSSLAIVYYFFAIIGEYQKLKEDPMDGWSRRDCLRDANGGDVTHEALDTFLHYFHAKRDEGRRFRGQEFGSFPIPGDSGFQGDAVWMIVQVESSTLGTIEDRDEMPNGVERKILCYAVAAPDHVCPDWRLADGQGYDLSCSHRTYFRKVGPVDWTPTLDDVNFFEDESNEAKVIGRGLQSLRVERGDMGYGSFNAKLVVSRNLRDSVVYKDMPLPRGYLGVSEGWAVDFTIDEDEVSE